MNKETQTQDSVTGPSSMNVYLGEGMDNLWSPNIRGVNNINKKHGKCHGSHEVYAKWGNCCTGDW